MSLSSHFNRKKILRDSTSVFCYILSRIVLLTCNVSKTNTKGPHHETRSMQ